MGKMTVAICETDAGYRERLVAYLTERKALAYAVYAFSSEEHFFEAWKDTEFDVAILGNGFKEAEKRICEQQFPAVFLRETREECLAHEDEKACGQERKKCVFRYQPIEAILREVQLLGGGTSCPIIGARLSRLEVIGVYSPMAHEMQMPFSLTLAEALAEQKKVLYLNFMRHSAFLQLFGLQGQYDMGDIVLRLRRQRLETEFFLTCVYESGCVYYIPPFGNPENLDDFTGRDFSQLLAFLEEHTDFSAVVCDFGDGIRGFSQLLETCSSIYCLIKNGFFYECRMEAFLEYLRRGQRQELCERIQSIMLPFSAKQIRGGGDVRRQLLWSEFGDYVRQKLHGGVL